MTYLLYFFSAYSFAFIITKQKIFQEIRSYLLYRSETENNIIIRKICQLFHCISCSGFWAGAVVTEMGLNIINIGFWDFFIGGLLSSIFCYFVDILRQIIEEVSYNKWKIRM